MKTITEMQQELKEMSGKLDDLSKELSEYGSDNSAGNIMDYKHLKALASRYPIEDHPLSYIEDETVKKRYMTLLLSLLYVSSGNTEGAWLLAQRIALGCNVETELSDIAIDARQITGDQIDEFTNDLLEAKLGKSFLLDSMLLYLSCEAKDERLLESISGMTELLQLDCKDTEIIARTAQRISAGKLPLLPDTVLSVQWWNVGEIIEFGCWPENEGEEFELLQWKIIDKEEDRLLLLCEDYFGQNRWQGAMDYVAGEFYNNFFDKYNKQLMPEKAFLLSEEQVEKYLPNQEDRAFESAWWTSTTCYGSYAYYLCTNGATSHARCRDPFPTTRPAIWVNY